MSKGKKTTRPGQVRIIGGRWRRHRIPLPAGDRIRPTGDRVRETLFNWLTPVIEGARCLDLFAGSGALGLEGLSRGAGKSVFVELDTAAASRLGATLDELQCRDATVVNSDARRFLSTEPMPFDIVWLDPPFGEFDLANVCTLLDNGWLAPKAYIYLELSRHEDLPELPSGWVVDRDKTAGQVRFALVRRA